MSEVQQNSFRAYFPRKSFCSVSSQAKNVHQQRSDFDARKMKYGESCNERALPFFVTEKKNIHKKVTREEEATKSWLRAMEGGKKVSFLLLI